MVQSSRVNSKNSVGLDLSKSAYSSEISKKSKKRSRSIDSISISESELESGYSKSGNSKSKKSTN